MQNYVMNTTLSKTASNAGQCVKCGKCAKHCPQHIDIPAQMGDVQKDLEGPIYKLVKRFKGIMFRS